MIRYDVIAAHSTATPDRVALSDATSSMTWSAFAAAVARDSGALVDVLEGRTTDLPLRATFLADNSLDVVVFQAACATLGLATVGMDVSLPTAHLASALDQVRPVVLAITADQRALAEAVLATADHRPPVLLVLGDETGAGDGPWLTLAALATAAPWPRADWSRPPFEGLGFTSGTSGPPKLVIRRESFEARRHAAVVETFGVTRDDVYLNTVPLYHASAGGWARIFLTEGAHVVVTENQAPDIARAALAHRTTFTLITPPMLAAYTRGVLDGQWDRAPLRAIVTGGRHVSARLVRDIRSAFGAVLHVYYGTTETGLNTLAGPADLATDHATAGPAFPGNTLAILGADGRPVPPGRTGSVAVSGYMLAAEFGDHTAPVVDVDGERFWVTADTGRLDDHGRLTILGRDLGGEAHDLTGTESRLRDLPCLSDAAVALVGYGDARRAVVAYVPSPTAQDVVSDVVSAIAAELLVGLDIRCVELPAIPYSPTGKVRPAMLLERTGV